MISKVQEYGIPLWLLREYLEELGGEADGENRVIGDGWTASLSKAEPVKVGSLRIGRVRLELKGDPDAIARFEPRLEMKTIRGGG
jgi:hypothetical protein